MKSQNVIPVCWLQCSDILCYINQWSIFPLETKLGEQQRKEKNLHKGMLHFLPRLRLITVRMWKHWAVFIFTLHKSLPFQVCRQKSELKRQGHEIKPHSNLDKKPFSIIQQNHQLYGETPILLSFKIPLWYYSMTPRNSKPMLFRW